MGSKIFIQFSLRGEYLCLGTGIFLTSQPSANFSLLMGGNAALACRRVLDGNFIQEIKTFGNMETSIVSERSVDSTPDDSTDSVSILSVSAIFLLRGLRGALKSSLDLDTTSIISLIVWKVFNLF